MCRKKVHVGHLGGAKHPSGGNCPLVPMSVTKTPHKSILALYVFSCISARLKRTRCMVRPVDQQNEPLAVREFKKNLGGTTPPPYARACGCTFSRVHGSWSGNSLKRAKWGVLGMPPQWDTGAKPRQWVLAVADLRFLEEVTLRIRRKLRSLGLRENFMHLWIRTSRGGYRWWLDHNRCYVNKTSNRLTGRNSKCNTYAVNEWLFCSGLQWWLLKSDRGQALSLASSVAWDVIFFVI